MALQAGLPPPEYRLSGPGSRPQAARYLAAVKAGYLTRYDALEDFFLEALGRGREAAEGAAAGGVKPRAPSKTEES